MAKSQIPDISPPTVQGGFNLPIPEGDPGQPSVGKTGNKPSINHSKNLPMTNNKRAPFKSKVIFDN